MLRSSRLVLSARRCLAVPHTVQVECRSNGHVPLRILQRQQQPSPILLYLPPGPLLSGHSPLDQEDILHQLQQASGATVISIDYRLGPEHRYPTPVHDVLTAYDWVLEHLASQPQHCSPNRPHLARIGVCGELIGGSLATMLALTECQLASHRIVAAAVNNPVVDWIFPSDLQELQHDDAESENVSAWLEDLALSMGGGSVPRENKLKKNPATQPSSWDSYAHNPALPSSAIAHARSELFPNPDAYFDRFASPIHFFRTPGINYVVPVKTEDDLASEVPTEFNIMDSVEPVLEERRRSHRIYPPTGLALRLPLLSVSVGEESVLLDQAEEFVRLMKRSMSRDFDSEDEANRRVGLRLRPGAGLWSGPFRGPNWEKEIGAIGAWFGRVLG
ncbi:Alpha beta hydrolase [Lasiodiplodia theobromae]|uniref:Alpha beta hydrolase n=1 Tax=Lasiodiplodia theobromae TaxID=45133 RepID=UPI0015C35A53|nr:Alpha beta hydrolase [Lasiodiplodia theobromae]KAF4541926.1 Alpha beta hydrolase [Lasiodiplodia theobromae]